MNVALHPDRLNVLSICTGGGGLDLGIELAMPRARIVCMVEREAFAVAKLVAAMQDGLLAPAPVWSNARTFDGRRWRGCVDMLIGGIPCQPHSLAGKRLGRDDERDLWSRTRRIIVQSGAWIVLIENVGGMLSSGGAERAWRDLGRLGFAREIGLFTASEVGASHERERLFILAVADARRAKWRAFAGLRRLSDRDAPGRKQGTGGIAEPGEMLADTESDIGWTELEAEGTRGGRARSPGDGDALGYAEHRRFEGRVADGDRASTAVSSNGKILVDATLVGRREGRAQPEFWSGRDPTGGAGSLAMDDASVARMWPVSIQPRRQDEACGDPNRPSLFPPRPDDRVGWQHVIDRAPHLEPAIRRMADGMAFRVDELRMLGNGVVPLEAGYAFRTLCSRLARRSAGANELVRMMDFT